MQFGAHESISGGLFNAVYRGQQATCDTIQLFNKASNQWLAKKLGAEEIDQYFAAIDETGVTVVCSHTSYLINLASSDPELQAKSRASLKEEMERCSLLDIPHLILHPGAHTGAGEDIGMDNIADSINALYTALPDNDVTLCLETTAGQGSVLGATFEQLAGIIDRLEHQDQVGVCLDTCHIFAAGYPIGDREDYLRTMGVFEATIGLERLKVIHLNDSKASLGTHCDRHEHIGQGEIGLEAFRHFVNDPRLKNTPMIIETPKGDELVEDVENLRVLRALVKKPRQKATAKVLGKARPGRKAS